MGSIDFENRFWLQILGDHLRFFEKTLASTEKEFLNRTLNLKTRFDNALENARKPLNVTNEALSLSLELRQLKADILKQHLVGKVSISLPPTFINHMLNEIDEYIRLLTEFKNTGSIVESNVLHHHKLWLPDAAGHTDGVICNLDSVESDKRKELKKLQKEFKCLWEKTVEAIGYLHSGVINIPAIDTLTIKADFEIRLFIQLLEEIREMRIDKTLLGTLEPLMADHMIREEMYYLRKLSTSLELAPIGDPTYPRVE